MLLNVSGCGPPTGREALTGETPLEVGVEELYTVGALEGEESEVFGRIGAVAFSTNGNLRHTSFANTIDVERIR